MDDIDKIIETIGFTIGALILLPVTIPFDFVNWVIGSSRF